MGGAGVGRFEVGTICAGTDAAVYRSILEDRSAFVLVTYGNVLHRKLLQ